jgi:uncharacterized protein (TIGR02145 family)
MKYRVLIYPLLLGLALLIFNSCKKPVDRKILPELKTIDVIDLTGGTANCGGIINSDGDSPIIVRGICWSTGPTPTTSDNKTIDGSGSGSFTSSLKGLTPNTKYNVRAYATNNSGTGYGNLMTFTTLPLPVLITYNVLNVTIHDALGGGGVSLDGGSPIKARGICWSTETTPTISNNFTSDGTGTGDFSSSLNGLMQDTKYFVRAYATNTSGTGYGNTLTFTTLPENGKIVKDIDNNVYHTVTIGYQVWLKENLNTTHYRNGEPIPNRQDSITWYKEQSGAYCEYGNLPANGQTYGKLYNWYAVNDPRNLCPTGWHVPIVADWEILITFLGGKQVAGGKLKETGTSHWLTPNTGATNETEFTALPSGYRIGIYQSHPLPRAQFESMGKATYFWTYSLLNKTTYLIQFSSGYLNDYIAEKNQGLPVRCIRDN